MKTKETALIRVTVETKKKLDNMKSIYSYNEYIEDMISYFEQTGMTPQGKFKIPIIKLEKRIEDLIKIVKCQEKDIFLPLLRRDMPSATVDNKDVLIRLSNENKALKEEVKRLKAVTSDNTNLYKNKLESLVSLLFSVCNKSNFRTVKFGSDLQVPPSFFDKLIERIKDDYVL